MEPAATGRGGHEENAFAAVALPDCTGQLRPVKATCCAGGLQIPDPSSLQLWEQDDHDLHIFTFAVSRKFMMFF